jgi:hypothetical protein
MQQESGKKSLLYYFINRGQDYFFVEFPPLENNKKAGLAKTKPALNRKNVSLNLKV